MKDILKQEISIQKNSKKVKVIYYSITFIPTIIVLPIDACIYLKLKIERFLNRKNKYITPSKFQTISKTKTLNYNIRRYVRMKIENYFNYNHNQKQIVDNPFRRNIINIRRNNSIKEFNNNKFEMVEISLPSLSSEEAISYDKPNMIISSQDDRKIIEI